MPPVIYPDITSIKKMNLMEGERVVLNFLWKHLASDYEVYYRPFINGDNPDIVIIRRKYGVVLIEICDWDLDKYTVREDGSWVEKSDDGDCKDLLWVSPFEKLTNYKSNLVNLHCNKFFEQNIKGDRIWSTISRMVYFHNVTQENALQFCNQKGCILPEQGSAKYRGIFGKDGLTDKALNDYFSVLHMNKPNSVFNDELYHDIQRYLRPPHHEIDEGLDIHYTKEQLQLIPSIAQARQKIKGVAGCGKTLVLAKRAVNAYIRTKQPVLILTFNLALKNYIRDRIADVRENFGWENFYITNYHQFFKEQANKYNLAVHSVEPFDNAHFFDRVKNRIKPFAAIFIDEIQDYKQEWIDIIVKNFADKETELVVFGDEKQNIYENALIEETESKQRELITRGIVGPWNQSLRTTFRLGNEIATLAKAFQMNFLQERYSIDEMSIMQSFNFEGRILEYYHAASTISADYIVDLIYKLTRLYDIHPSDVAVLGSTMEYMREVDYSIRTRYKENTSITFDTKEEYEQNNFQRNDGKCRARKNHLILRSGTIKLSTIHSFKGWEIHTVVLIIEDSERVNPELIYTGLTRAKQNLIILNLGNQTYDGFFSSRMHSQIIPMLDNEDNKR